MKRDSLNPVIDQANKKISLKMSNGFGSFYE